jgi:peptidoglycan/LPS O-acetylase OafA/YrhL
MLSPLLQRIPLLGALGVIVFNFITGFVLSLPYLGHHNRRSIPGGLDFFRQRFGRICRPYYPTLVLWTIPLIVLAAQEQDSHHLLLSFVTHLLFLHTLSASTFFAIVPAFWWLGLLAQFYLVCPWLLRFFAHVGPGRGCVMACIIPWLAWAVLTLLANQSPGSTLAMVHYLIYFNLPVRLPEFVIGMWLAFAWNRGLPIVQSRQRGAAQPSLVAVVISPPLVGLALFMLLNSVLLAQLGRPLDHIYLVFWCLLSVLAVFRWSLAIRLGSLRLVLDLAAASYGIYLLHQPLLGYANQLLGSALNPSGRFVFLLLGIGLLCYAAAVTLNIILYRLFQQ